MALYAKSSQVAPECKHLITPGKEYKVLNHISWGQITADNGEVLGIEYGGCGDPILGETPSGYHWSPWTLWRKADDQP